MELQDYHGDPTKTADALLDGHEVVEDLTGAVFLTERLRGCEKSHSLYIAGRAIDLTTRV